ncbi:aldehyde dehydrogenase family protein [Brucella abortus]|nr:aldehyde dehydrogenase family protein [Brucella abortus]
MSRWRDLAAAAALGLPAWSETPAEERIAYIRRIAEISQNHGSTNGKSHFDEMGAPIKLARESQAAAGLSHTKAFIAACENFEVEEVLSPNIQTRPSCMSQSAFAASSRHGTGQ